jgi:AcrR family transcriptional regulator
MMLTTNPAKDRRIQKTQRLLREALASLIREKPYNSIVVKQILDHANVGRSTFYAHFRDKDDLLVSCIHDMLHSMEPAPAGKSYETMIGFSLPIFEHIHRHMSQGAGRTDCRGHSKKFSRRKSGAPNFTGSSWSICDLDIHSRAQLVGGV